MHGHLETQPIGRNAETKELDEAAFPIRGDPGFGPARLTELAGQATAATALMPRRELPEFPPVAVRTFSHG